MKKVIMFFVIFSSLCLSKPLKMSIDRMAYDYNYGDRYLFNYKYSSRELAFEERIKFIRKIGDKTLLIFKHDMVIELDNKDAYSYLIGQSVKFTVVDWHMRRERKHLFSYDNYIVFDNVKIYSDDEYEKLDISESDEVVYKLPPRKYNNSAIAYKLGS